MKINILLFSFLTTLTIFAAQQIPANEPSLWHGDDARRFAEMQNHMNEGRFDIAFGTWSVMYHGGCNYCIGFWNWNPEQRRQMEQLKEQILEGRLRMPGYRNEDRNNQEPAYSARSNQIWWVVGTVCVAGAIFWIAKKMGWVGGKEEKKPKEKLA